jgi:hypothetical protein
MSWRTLILTAALSITAACVHAATARAIELRSTDQMPDMIDQNTGTVAISNIGNATLSISYLDGDWKTVQIPSGQYVSIPSQSTGLIQRWRGDEIAHPQPRHGVCASLECRAQSVGHPPLRRGRKTSERLPLTLVDGMSAMRQFFHWCSESTSLASH